ncbi:uncharacterized protein A4U43_C09F2540 [Asparagus officinalis]|uniref:Uncharacterized protein n=1 Tax=Asparagus officinalis TaxID=4686 RepID=A0A5P1E818_ASPOF|nr:uncharacterized protein A4U43_C09F2540 [Asparagus officinalis]
MKKGLTMPNPMEVGSYRGLFASKNGPEIVTVDGPQKGEKREAPSKESASAGYRLLASPRLRDLKGRPPLATCPVRQQIGLIRRGFGVPRPPARLLADRFVASLVGCVHVLVGFVTITCCCALHQAVFLIDYLIANGSERTLDDILECSFRISVSISAYSEVWFAACELGCGAWL